MQTFADFAGFRFAVFAFPTRNLNAKDAEMPQSSRRLGCNAQGGNTTGRECVLVGGKPPPRSSVWRSAVGPSPTALRCGKPHDGGKENDARLVSRECTDRKALSISNLKSQISNLKFEIDILCGVCVVSLGELCVSSKIVNAKNAEETRSSQRKKTAANARIGSPSKISNLKFEI